MSTVLLRAQALLAALWLSAATAAPSPAAGIAASSPALARIAKTGVVKVGYIPTPGTFAFLAEDGSTVGYSIDLCSRFIAQIRLALQRPDLQVAYRPLLPSQRIPLLKAGEIDMDCGGNTNTVGRQREVDFSYTFFTTGVRFLVRRPLSLDTPASLWRRKVAVTRGTTAEEIVQRLQREQEVRPVSVTSDAEGARLVAEGAADAFAQDDVLLYGLAASSPARASLAVAGQFLTVEPYAFMLPKDDPALRELCDKALSSLMQSGEIMAIYRKWFDTDRLRMPMNVYMHENLRFPSRYGIP